MFLYIDLAKEIAATNNELHPENFLDVFSIIRSKLYNVKLVRSSEGWLLRSLNDTEQKRQRVLKMLNTS